MRRSPGRGTTTGALPGYKIAYPMVSADGDAVGFNGVALGRSQVYGVVADAVCAQSARHAPPSSWCDCGFYCFHSAADARGLACDAEYPGSVVLEVLASGRYLSYELGLRYARQTVRAVRVGRCGCGRAADALAGTGQGVVGWRRLVAVCAPCAGSRPVVALATFARLAAPGADLDVTADAGLADPAFAPLEPRPDDPMLADALASVPLLHAEIALLQARMDDLQQRLDGLTGGDR